MKASHEDDPQPTEPVEPVIRKAIAMSDVQFAAGAPLVPSAVPASEVNDRTAVRTPGAERGRAGADPDPTAEDDPPTLAVPVPVIPPPPTARPSLRRAPLLATMAIIGSALIAAPFLFANGGLDHHARAASGAAASRAAAGALPGDGSPTPPSPTASASLSSAQPSTHLTRAVDPRPTDHLSSVGHDNPSAYAGPAPTGSWQLNAAWGPGDSTGRHSGQACGVAFSADMGGSFNGKNSAVTTSGPDLATGPGSSFTVSAWVSLSSTYAFATAVSQDGSMNSGFYLQYSVVDQRWAFSRVASDSADPASSRALSTSRPVLNHWTHLVGVYDFAAERLSLYVDGRLEGESVAATPYATGGDFVIGRGQYDGRPADWFPGRIGHVEVFSSALSATAVSRL